MPPARYPAEVPELAKIFSQNVTTDLTVGNILAFAQLASGMDAEQDVDFITAPLGSSFMYKGASLVTLDPDELLQVLNEHMNPYHQDIQRSDLQLVYKTSNGTLAVTSGKLLLSGNTTSSSSGSGSSKPSTSGGKNDTTTTTPSQEEPADTSEPVTPEEPKDNSGQTSTEPTPTPEPTLSPSPPLSPSPSRSPSLLPNLPQNLPPSLSRPPTPCPRTCPMRLKK